MVLDQGRPRLKRAAPKAHLTLLARFWRPRQQTPNLASILRSAAAVDRRARTRIRSAPNRPRNHGNPPEPPTVWLARPPVGCSSGIGPAAAPWSRAVARRAYREWENQS